MIDYYGASVAPEAAQASALNAVRVANLLDAQGAMGGGNLEYFSKLFNTTDVNGVSLLENIDGGVAKYMNDISAERIQGQFGHLNSLRIAVDRMEAGDLVALEASSVETGGITADVVVFPAAEAVGEAIEAKYVTGSTADAVAKNVLGAADQLQTNAPPSSFSRIVDINIDPHSAAFYNLDRAELAVAVRSYVFNPDSLATVTEVRIENGSGSYVFQPGELVSP